VHDHLQQCNGGDTDTLEIVWVFLPWLLVVDFLLLLGRVFIESVTSWVDKLDGVLELCRLLLADDLTSGN